MKVLFILPECRSSLKGMGLWACILLVVARASLSVSIPLTSNEIVSIATPSNFGIDDKSRDRVADTIQPHASISVKLDAKSSQMDCQSDDDCHQNQYCYDTGVCAACYECAVYFRYPSSTGCAKTPQMCGACETGYENEILSGGKVRDTCARTPTFQPETIFSGATWNSPHMWLFGFFVFMGLVVTVALLSVWGGGLGKRWAQKIRWRTGGGGGSRTYNLPSAPPLPSKDCDISRLCVEEPLVKPYIRQDIVATKSKPFDTSQISPKVVGWHNTDDGLDSTTQSFGEASGYQPTGQNPPELEDDSTIPSSWTPETLSEGALVTSFAGLFSSNSSNFNNNNPPHSNVVQNFTPDSSFNDSGASSSSTSTGSGGGSPGSTTTTSTNGGPVHILVQGGVGQSSVHCSVMVNNIQINEY